MAELNITLSTTPTANGTTVIDKIELKKPSKILKILLAVKLVRNTMNSSSSSSARPTINFYDKNNNLLNSVSFSYSANKNNNSSGAYTRTETINNIDLDKVKYIELSSYFSFSGASASSQTATATVYYEEPQISEIIKNSVIEVIQNHELIQYVVPYKENE